MTIAPYPLKFQPVLHERVWGGNYLAQLFRVDDARTVGEAWTLSDYSSSPSICLNGRLAGLSLGDIIRRYPKHYLGRSEPGQFPLLIKFIDAVSDLSVQVHPGNQLARELEGQQGKTETWFVLDTHAGGEVVLGHTFPTPDAVKEAAQSGTISSYIKRSKVKVNDIIHIPAGTVHALLGGTKVIEIQQTSDVTYRLYDWERLGQDGKPRALHVQKAARAITYSPEPNSCHMTSEPSRQSVLVECPYYSLEEHHLTSERYLTDSPKPQVLIVTQGSGSIVSGGQDYPLVKGDTYLLPVGMDELIVRPCEPTHVLLVTVGEGTNGSYRG